MPDRGNRALTGVDDGMLDAGALEDADGVLGRVALADAAEVDRHAVGREAYPIGWHQKHLFEADAPPCLDDRLGRRRAAARLRRLPQPDQRADRDVEAAAGAP